jgi:hypothetical protein
VTVDLVKLEEEIESAMLSAAPAETGLPVLLGELKEYILVIKSHAADVTSHIQDFADPRNALMLSSATDQAPLFESRHLQNQNSPSSPRHSSAYAESARKRNTQESWTFDDQNDLPFTNVQGHTSGSIHEAIRSGDFSSLKRILNRRHHLFSGSAGYDSASQEGGRRMNTKNTDKPVQCKELAQMAQYMTIYDIITYFYTDDIDEDSGEFDDISDKPNEPTGASPLTQFDDADVLGKHKMIKNLAQTILSGFDTETCDELLSQFHRFLEDENEVDQHWIQGSVNKQT